MAAQPHYLHVFSTFAPAGQELRSAALMMAMDPNIRHSVISCSGNVETADIIGDQADLTLLPFANDPGPLSGMRAMRRILREQDPDLLLTYNWGAMDATFAARALRYPHHVHHEDGFNADEAQRLKARRNWARRLTLQSAELIVPSRRLETIAREVWKLRKVNLISNGVRFDRFARDASKRAAFRKTHGIPADAFVVGTVAHFRPVKALHRMIDAVAQVALEDERPIVLVLVGDGEQMGALRERAAARCPRPGTVIFAGLLSDPSEAYCGFDVLGLSSESEQQPVSILEAMASSLPIVATAVGDVEHIVPPEGRSYLVDPQLPEESIVQGLARSLQTLGNARGEAQALGEACYAWAKERFSFKAMLQAYESIFARTRRNSA